MNDLILLQNMSNRYGSDPAYVLAGGGNTSFKSDEILYIKGSGTSLSTIKADDFVRMDRKKLAQMWDNKYPEDEAERERVVLSDMMDARVEGETRRPSVETLLHDIFPQKFILHVHPSSINGMTCGVKGKEISKELFPDSVWVDACRPGYILASLCREKLTSYKASKGKDADLLFLQNHGVFFAGNTVEEIDALAFSVMKTLEDYIRAQKEEKVNAIAELAKSVTGYTFSDTVKGNGICSFDANRNSPTPDHIVYCKAKYFTCNLNVEKETLKEALESFNKENGYYPRVIIIKGVCALLLGDSEKMITTNVAILKDHVSVCKNAEAFGGYNGMTDDLVDFIVNWEVESYRAKVNA